MKKYVGILFALTALTSTATLAGDPSFADFAVKKAHEVGFTGCDSAIRHHLQHAGGDENRIEVKAYKDTSMLTMVSTWGSKGYSAFSKATFLKQGNKCIYDETSIVTTSESCLAYAQSPPTLKYIAETGDYIWMESEGGTNLLLKPVENGCVATFSFSNKV